ncbi:MAG TPA: hypothetical protein VE261_01405, partial [Gaiellaceae bacterium]|nr:hypothetical protein [Gaiellaceae bacterium]
KRALMATFDRLLTKSARGDELVRWTLKRFTTPATGDALEHYEHEPPGESGWYLDAAANGRWAVYRNEEIVRGEEPDLRRAQLRALAVYFAMTRPFL